MITIGPQLFWSSVGHSSYCPLVVRGWRYHGVFYSAQDSWVQDRIVQVKISVASTLRKPYVDGKRKAKHWSGDSEAFNRLLRWQGVSKGHSSCHAKGRDLEGKWRDTVGPGVSGVEVHLVRTESQSLYPSVFSLTVALTKTTLAGTVDGFKIEQKDGTRGR